MLQMKKQDKLLRKQLNEEETSNLSKIDFGVIMIVKMSQDLGKRIEEQIEKIQECLTKSRASPLAQW